MKRPTCKTCAYWEPTSKSSVAGNCHASPPRDTEGMSRFPAVYDDEFCGAHHLFPAYLNYLKANHRGD